MINLSWLTFLVLSLLFFRLTSVKRGSTLPQYLADLLQILCGLRVPKFLKIKTAKITGERVQTCRSWKSAKGLSWGIGCQQTAWREGDVIQADVTLWTPADLALEDHLKIGNVAQRDLPHLPVVALISGQGQKWVKTALAPPPHAEGADAIARHVKVETHLLRKKRMSQRLSVLFFYSDFQAKEKRINNKNDWQVKAISGFILPLFF